MAVEPQRNDSEALDAALSRWELRFAQSPVPEVLLDRLGRIERVNNAFCRLVDRTPHELQASTLPDLVRPEDDTADGLSLHHLLDGSRGWLRAPLLIRSVGDSLRSVLLVATALRPDDGDTQAVSAIFLPLDDVREAERRRVQQEEFFAVLTAHANDLAIVLDPTGSLVYASPAITHLFGYSVSDVLAADPWSFVHPDDLPLARDVFRDVVTHRVTGSATVRLRSANGTWRWAEATATSLVDTSVGGIVCNLVDVSERVAAEQALRASEARYRTIADTAQEGIWAVDPDGRTLYANARMADMLGVPLSELYARSALSFLRADELPEIQRRLRERAIRGPERYEVGYDHPDGAPRQLLVAAAPLPGDDAEATGTLAMVSDVTDVRRIEHELRRAALHDPLTGLPNRALLLDRLEHALARETIGTGVLFLDLDHFKVVNDSRGHDTGDELLVAVAARLASVARRQDTVARFGGDEFVIVCEDVSSEEAEARGRQFADAVTGPIAVGDTTVHVSASVGVAVSPPASARDLLRFADTAMYSAKGAGRGRVVVFDRGLADQAEQRYALGAELRRAVERDELELHYQPVVELQTGRVLGMEALARWTHPELGPVEPATFVAVAEATGMSAALDAWALSRALREFAAVRRAERVPRESYVAVNVSARHLAEPNFEQVVLTALRDAELPAERVVLEITEGAVMNDPERAVAVLGRLRERGFGVAVDDFGTGYSSLAYLRDLPITSLKIDKSFIANITEDRDSLAIVASIADLARAVGVEVVAEGVETAQQAALLRRLGCAAAQGWLWSRAVPAHELETSPAWLRGFDAASGTRSRVPPVRRRIVEPLGPEHGVERLLALHRSGASLATIASALNSEGFRTPSGARWHRTSVARAIADSAYPALGDAGTEHDSRGVSAP